MVLQVVSVGAKTWKRIEPVIVPTPPLRWATSWIGEPTVTGPEAVVLRGGRRRRFVRAQPLVRA